MVRVRLQTNLGSVSVPLDGGGAGAASDGSTSSTGVLRWLRPAVSVDALGQELGPVAPYGRPRFADLHPFVFPALVVGGIAAVGFVLGRVVR